jgi:hypothetical protein
MGQTSIAGTDTANMDLVNGYWKTATDALPQSVLVLPESLVSDDYLTSIGWNDPDNIHKDDEFWRAIGAYLWTGIFSGQSQSVAFNPYYATGSGRYYGLGSSPEHLASDGEQVFQFPASATARARVGMSGINPANGAGATIEAWWQAHNHAKLADGLVLRCIGINTPWLVTVDLAGGVRLGPYDATFPSAYTDGDSRLYILQDYNIKGCITCNHSSASATWLQRWQLQGVTVAEMREDGELNLKTITTAAAYADDTAAAAAGIPVGGLYRVTGGTVAWRQA